MAILEDIAGLGYSGYCKINNVFVPYNPSSVSESDNHIEAEASIGNNPSHPMGRIPVRSRKSLDVTISTDITLTTLELLNTELLTPRFNGSVYYETPLEIVSARGLGYKTTEAYLESVSLSATPESLGTMDFTFKAWVWEEMDFDPLISGSVGPKVSSQVFSVLGQDHYPIPGWQTKFESSGQSGDCLDWSVDFNNNYTYKTFCEATTIPPNPRLVYKGRLECTFSTSTLTEKDNRPEECTDIKFTFGGSCPNTSARYIPARYLDILEAYRNSRSMSGYGSQDELVRWTADYSALGQTPVLST